MERDLSSVPTPRRVAEYAAALGRLRDLARALRGGPLVPDLGLAGPLARAAARGVLFEVLAREGGDEPFVETDFVTFAGMQVAQAETAWRRVADRCHEQGVLVPEPRFESRNELVGGQVRVATRVTLDLSAIGFVHDRAHAYRRLLGDTRSWYHADGWTCLADGRHGVAIRPTRAVMASVLAAKHLETIALAIFEAWWRQRESWHSKTVRVRGKDISTAPSRVLRLAPDELLARVSARDRLGPNWRARLRDALFFIAGLEFRIVANSGVEAPIIRMIDDVIDMRSGLREGLSTPLSDALGLAARGLDDAFYVSVPHDVIASLVPTEEDASGGVRYWGRVSKKRGGQRAPRQVSYYRHQPALEIVAAKEHWSPGARRIARQLQQELRAGKGSRPAWHPCNGGGDHGYRVVVWMRKTGHVGMSRAPRHRDVNRFVDDLQFVRNALGLRVQLTHDDREFAFGMRGWMLPSVALLRLWLPTGWEEHMQLLATRALGPDFDLARPGALRAARNAAGLTQRYVGGRLGVSAACVSQWESGARRIPPARVPTLEWVLGISRTHHSVAEVRHEVTTPVLDVSNKSPVPVHGGVTSPVSDASCDVGPPVQILTKDSLGVRPFPAAAGPDTCRDQAQPSPETPPGAASIGSTRQHRQRELAGQAAGGRLVTRAPSRPSPLRDRSGSHPIPEPPDRPPYVRDQPGRPGPWRARHEEQC